jgi:hypothetical protein
LAVQEEECYRLDPARGGLGLRCEEAGLLLAGVPLLRKTGEAFAPRPVHEIEALVKSAYGRERDVIRLEAGLRVAADALNNGDISRAMIAALHLRLPSLDSAGAAGIAQADDVLAKYNYNSDEPRDERGRWTTGGGAAAAAAPSSRQSTPADASARQRRFPNTNQLAADPTRPERSWNGPVHLYSGRIIPVEGGPVEGGGIGGNGGPPLEPVPEGTRFGESNRLRPEAAQGGETSSPPIGYFVGDPNHPMRADGTFWTIATHDVILQTLQGKNPQMTIFVPVSRLGPVLAGSDEEKDYACPEGYTAVKLSGIPQVTRPVGRPSFHAHDSVDEALELAKTDQFNTIYFNRKFVTLTKGQVRSNIQSDVVAVARPELNLEHIYHPVEVMSPRQTQRQLQQRMPVDPRIKPLKFRDFRSSSYRRSPYFTYFDTPSYDA